MIPLLKKEIRAILLLLSVAALVVWSSLSHAASDESVRVRNFVDDTSAQVNTIVNSTSSEAVKLQKLVSVFERVVDIEWMSKFVLGRYWRQFSDKQKQDYLSAYTQYLTNSYVPKFREYNGKNFVLNEVRYIPENETYLVMMQIANAGNSGINVVYRCSVGDDGTIKVRDIIADNISLLATQRADFGSVVERNGAQGLINVLKQKAKDLISS